ncbi:MAG: PUR family DNA/RNA-binding protein [Bacteroidales bacterium]|nr:PUR family DNA/RNA-binding protein [Bacteroidales bacterium]
MGDTDKDLVYSESVKAGKRIYYFDVKQSRNGDKYIAITESKKINEGTAESPRFVFEKHKLFLYKEDYEKFVEALGRTLDVANGNAPVVASAEDASDVQASATQTSDAPVLSDEAVEDEKAEKKSFLDKVKNIF